MPDDEMPTTRGSSPLKTKKHRRFDEESVAKKEKARSAAIKNKDYENSDLQIAHALTEEEKTLCTHIVTNGVAYLRYEKKWSATAIRRFTDRAEVQKYIEHLQSTYQDRDGVQERTQFFAQMRVNSMVPAAIGILAKALRGDIIKQSGEVERAPTRQQYDAAVEVMTRANIQGLKFGGNENLPPIDARSVHLYLDGASDDASTGLDAASREKVRKTLGAVVGRIRNMGEADAKAKRAKRAKSRKKVEAKVVEAEVVDDDE